MKVHTDSSFWAALRTIVPNLPERDVSRCFITVLPREVVKVEIQMLAMDSDGLPLIKGEGDEKRYVYETKRFRIVPDEAPPT